MTLLSSDLKLSLLLFYLGLADKPKAKAVKDYLAVAVEAPSLKRILATGGGSQPAPLPDWPS